MGFSYPQGLYSLAFVAVLVWIYLRERHQRTLEVSSLLLWRAVKEESRRSRFRPDPLFLLQLLLLLALAVGVAEPYREESTTAVEARRTVLVFDTSASMQTIEDGERRFDVARREAQGVLAKIPVSEEVMIVAVEARPRIVVSFSRDRTEISRAVEALEPGDGPSRLALGVQLARSARGPDVAAFDIAVFTDLVRTEHSVPLAGGERLVYHRVGRTDDNVAVAALRVYQSPFQDAGEARAYALVKNYSGHEKEVTLHVTLGAREMLAETLRLQPREGRAVPIRALGAPGRLEARLDVADALSIDNRAIAYVRPMRAIRLLAVSRNEAFSQDLRTLAEAIPALELRETDPETFQGDSLQNVDVAIFHGTVPEGPIRSNSLFVYPPVDNPRFQIESEVVRAQILDWNEHDSILRDLRYIEALPLERSRLIRLPEWARMLIASRAGAEEFPLAFAGETEGRRVVCFAFDLAERSVRNSENLSLLLLVLNALKWLTPPDPAQPLQIDVGDRFRETLPEPRQVAVVAPDGTRRIWPSLPEVAIDVERRGEYRILLGTEERVVYANLFDAEESDIGRDAPVGVEVVQASSTSIRYVTARLLREYGSWLYLAAMMLVLGEWLFAMRRRSRVDV